jgi:hypothetical protein
VTQCPLCFSPALYTHPTAEILRLESKSIMVVVPVSRCAQCGHVWTDEDAEDARLSAIRQEVGNCSWTQLRLFAIQADGH